MAGDQPVREDAGYLQRLTEIDDAVRQARRDPGVMLERAAGLLAGRVGVRVDDARTHLLQLAAEQGRRAGDVATEILTALQGGATADGHRISAQVRGATRPTRRRRVRPHQPQASPVPVEDWVRTAQEMLDAMGGRHVLLLPIRGDTGQLEDYEVVAAGPTVVDRAGRCNADLVGRRLRDLYPALADTPAWQLAADAATDGQPREVGPFAYVTESAHGPQTVILTVRLHPVGPGVLVTWRRRDEDNRIEERLDHTERLGNLGWGEWDLRTDTTVWSDGLYRIYERDPGDGPLPRSAADGMTLPEDTHVLEQAKEAFGRGETVDAVLRLRIGDRVKHLRIVVDALRDLEGRPLKVYGLCQDVTARETSRAKLAEVERQLREHQASLAAEHRLAAQLQNIVLPIPDGPIDLPGLRVAVRYRPAERASRVGGDWYHAAAARDGSVVVAVGDVAGHGVRAAATMAQLRHALAALIVTATTEPATLLGYLNQLLYEGGVWAATATMVLARYHPATGVLEWAQAGHPAPLLSRAGTTTQLARPAGPLLGAVRDATYQVATTVIAPGDVLVCYTDGLVEQRHRTLAEGLAPVVATLDRITAARRHQPLSDLLDELDRANAEDDTCILAARPVPLTPDPPAAGGDRPSAAGGTGEAVRRWPA